jgi:hypothetical protein
MSSLVGEQKRFRQHHAAVGGIVQRALQQAQRGVVPRDARQRRDEARQAVDVLGGDGVALEGHGARPDLPGAEGFAPLAKGRALQQPQVEGKFVQAGADAGQRVEHQPVLFARISLRGYRKWLQAEPRHHRCFQRWGAQPRARQEMA